MTWRPRDVLMILIALTVVILVLRYAKVIIRTLMLLGGLLFLAIAGLILALAMGWWQPSLPTLMDLLKAVF